MATLVLSTAGTILGGPIGGAIGSFLGQSIDHQLFGSGPRQGPRLGDLAVQSSSYGSPIPKLFGTMRVAGTIVWSTDLQERSETTTAKGQPDSISYSYSVSFAVALSSRPISTVRRIWADGKLIRTAEGEFTIPTGFRICDGSEAQAPDPLISSTEGLDSTPAYRGIALAIFEDLQLADFGNRIPFLTFEVVADDGPVPAARILSETSGGIIASTATATVDGYAAYGATVTAAVEPLVELRGISLFDGGEVLSTPAVQLVTVDEAETGCSAGQHEAPRFERSQVPAQNVPSAIAISYYDPARDYQTGLARASIDAGPTTSERLQLPAVLGAGAAKALVETFLGRRWAERDRLTLRLPPAYFDLRPGASVVPPDGDGAWRVHRVTIDSMAAVVELRPIFATMDILPADAGRVLPSDVLVPGATTIALVELPDDGAGTATSPILAVAAATPARSVPLVVQAGGADYAMRTASRPAILGTSATVLMPGQSAIFDLANSFEVELHEPNDWLESRDDDALAAGANVAALGSELIQFGSAVSLGGGRFRLSRLLRGRRGTEWAMDQHEVGDGFVLLNPAVLQLLPLASAQIGAMLRVTPEGMADDGSAFVEHVVRGDAMRPPCPVHLRATFDSAGNLNCSWVRRSSAGWAWLDGVDAPLGCAVERYRVALVSASGEIEIETGGPQLQFTAVQVAAAGSGELQLRVVQVGDFAASYPALLPITFNQD